MLRKVFVSFASFAVRTPTEDLDGAKFSKLCKDAKLLGRNLSTIEVDIVFAKVKVGLINIMLHENELLHLQLYVLNSWRLFTHERKRRHW